MKYLNMEKLPAVVKSPILLLLVPLVVVLVGAAIFGVYQYKKVSTELAQAKSSTTPGTLTDERQRELIAEVSSKIMLPTDEKPTVAVVSDINRLKDQQFFSGGQNGDVVLIYMNTRKAILYRPQEKKIIEVAPVNLNQQAATVAGTTTNNPQPTTNNSQPSAPTPTPLPAKYALRNGTTITGLAKTFETQLKAKYPTAQVVETGNAAVRTYSTTTIVDVSGKRSEEAEEIATSLGITKGTLPANELTPSTADFLIILGTDRQ